MAAKYLNCWGGGCEIAGGDKEARVKRQAIWPGKKEAIIHFRQNLRLLFPIYDFPLQIHESDIHPFSTYGVLKAVFLAGRLRPGIHSAAPFSFFWHALCAFLKFTS